MKKVTVLVLGAGNRGTTYAGYSLAHPGEMGVAGAAEPREDRRRAFAEKFGLDAGHVFSTWEEALDRPKFADAVIIATQDNMHYAPLLAALKRGYHVLVEKPMAPSEKECRAMVRAAGRHKRICAVCHVLRYTPYFRKIKEIIDSGTIGRVMTVQHMEPVGYWHHAHSFVRGNWRKASESSPMILAKSCHDMDIIRWLVGKPCRQISSFGSLLWFRPENAPEGSTERCTDDCAVEAECPYSALKLYLDMEKRDWPVNVITMDLSREGRLKALKEGPYGRCVFRCDNDVVDHQVAAMSFDGGMTAVFTMSAFTLQKHRETYVGGTHGMIQGDGSIIGTTVFLGEKKRVIDTQSAGPDAGSGHGGGDFGLMQDFVRAVREEDPGLLSSPLDVSLESHLMAFAAEKSRLISGTTVSL